MQPRCFDDYRRLAARRLPRFMYEYVEAGSYGEVTLAANQADLAAVALRQRVLCDVSRVDIGTSWFGVPTTLPVALAPVGMAGMMARRGEVQAARAARDAGIPFTLSSAACCAVEEVADGCRAPFWYQLYMLNDRGYMTALIDRVRRAGCSVLVLTVDTPVLSARYRDFRAGISTDPWLVRMARMAMQTLPRPHWSWHVGVRGRPHGLGNMTAAVGPDATLAQVVGWMQSNLKASLDWADVDWIRSQWHGPILIKGILDLDDARRAADAPIDGLIVSNHGGRQLDGALSTARALPAIADAVGDRLTIMADGGVRSGLDVARMLALGAKGVLVGRAWAYALAADGEAGVGRMIGLLAAELRTAMALTGVTRIADLGRANLAEALKN